MNKPPIIIKDTAALSLVERQRVILSETVSSAEINKALARQKVPAVACPRYVRELETGEKSLVREAPASPATPIGTTAPQGEFISEAKQEELQNLLENPRKPRYLEEDGWEAERELPKTIKPCFGPSGEMRESWQENGGSLHELEDEFDAQVQGQQDGLNDLTVSEYTENRNRYRNLKKQTGSGRGSGEAQRKFREEFKEDLMVSIAKEKQLAGVDPEFITDEFLEMEANRIMSSLAALHEPDMIAGGNNEVTRMGNKSVNSSLGAQWKEKQRIRIMDDYATEMNAQHGPNAKMNVKLERCARVEG